MSGYNSDNTLVLATHEQIGSNTRMLLLHVRRDGTHEYIIGSYFKSAHNHGMLGYECWEYSWDWGHYFNNLVSAVDFWEAEVLGRKE